MKTKFGFLVFIFLNLVAAALNYATYPFLTRALPSSAFVNVTVALSVLTQVATLLSAIVALTVGLTKEKKGAAIVTASSLQSVVIKLFFLLSVLFFVFSPFTFEYLGLSFLLAVPVVALLIFSVPTFITSGKLTSSGHLTQVGIVAAVTAACQLGFCVVGSFIFRTEAAALFSMVAGQVVSLLVIRILLGRQSVIFPTHRSLTVNIHTNRKTRYRIIWFIVTASVSVMAVNLLQIMDLLVVKSLNTEVELYTNFYVVSRAVFFGGAMLVWPLLSWIDVHNHRTNIASLTKVFALVVGICASGIVAIYLFGDLIMRLITGETYETGTILEVGGLSILYKLSYILIIISTLYLVAIRSYWSSIVAISLTLASGVYFILASPNLPLDQLLVQINIIGAGGVVLCIFALLASLKDKMRLEAKLT